MDKDEWKSKFEVREGNKVIVLTVDELIDTLISQRLSRSHFSSLIRAEEQLHKSLEQADMVAGEELVEKAAAGLRLELVKFIRMAEKAKGLKNAEQDDKNCN